MDSTTRRKIDALRDTLVGKLPVPTQQVEQITLALLYKFMYDLDEQNVELGGARQFFTNGYKRYAWNNIIDKSLSGQERVNAYGEALEKMAQNPKLPQLFRDIFARAYLPFRDPQTLNLFLQQIDDFTYEHSEDLGDAFEYLLSVMGSQGDAGQFRTPRHIIDFIVEAVDPDLEMRILDPACGTAGFLISAYKHIMMKYADDKGRPGAKLTPGQKKKLAQQFTGYDISHDMVRLSLVNMYLHNLPEPEIYEYDALTSEDKWGERAECILANPPFMSPKGGIRPHKKFAINATRSEVLFADYMLEHLTTGGRAGFIVPEGIIFQSGTAYKALRKMLVDEGYLWAVVSLPAGVFQPYSGVKTSILLIDRNLAKGPPPGPLLLKEGEKTNPPPKEGGGQGGGPGAGNILFLKIENDGFDLGAQRRPIEKNDLPGALELINLYKAHHVIPANAGIQAPARSENQDLDSRVRGNDNSSSFLIVPKEKIAASGDYNLSMDRYRESVIGPAQKWPMVKLGDVAQIRTGKKDVNEGNSNGIYPFFTCAKEHTFSDSFSFDTEALLVAGNGDVGNVTYYNGKFEAYQRTYVLSDFKGISARLLFHFLSTRLKETVSAQKLGNTMPYIKLGMLSEFQIPLPPLPVQEALVTELERYRKMIEGARAILANYKPEIEIDPKWEMRELGEVCEGILTGPFGTALHQSDYVENGIPVINPQNIENGRIIIEGAKTISPSTRNKLKEFTIRENDIIIGRRGEMGRCAVVGHGMDGWLCGTGCFVIRLKKSYDSQFVYYQISSSRIVAYLEEQAVGVTMKNLNQGILTRLTIGAPPLADQQTIVARLESERAEMEMLKGLIVRMEAKIKGRVAGLWGE